MDIKESLRKKLQNIRYYADFQQEIPKHAESLSYEQAILAGDIGVMLNHKLHIYEEEDRQAELDEFFEVE